MRKQSWAGTVCCFILFIVVFISQRFLLSAGYPVRDGMNLGMLCFILPGVIASIFSRHARVAKPALGALLAAPVCLLLFTFWLAPGRSFWQELAWILSAVFWCALGALCYLFLLTLIRHYDALRHRL